MLSWDGTGWDDCRAIADAIASGPSAWETGQKHGYHGVTFGWLVGELVQRIAGVSLGGFFSAEIAQPFRIECQIGTPVEVQDCVAPVIEWTPASSRRSTLTAIDPDSWAGMSVLAGPEGTCLPISTAPHDSPRS
jgi:CubicO group peptidase (beta-lactamase class C family)